MDVWKAKAAFRQMIHLNVAEVMASVAAETGVDQHSVQAVDLGLSLRLRHEGPQLQVLWIFNILVKTKKYC